MHVYDLGLAPDEWTTLTPAQTAALIDRKEEQDRFTDSRFGMIVSTIINFANSFGEGQKKHVGPLEVMGYDEDERGEPKQRPQSQLEVALRFRLLSAANKVGTGVNKASV